MIAEPLVSVVIPAYNRPDYVAQAVESVCCQTYKNWEVIIVDDCSQGDCINHYPVGERIKIICLASNSGAAAARNVGVREAAGEYVAFLDMDDYWLPNKLELQIDAFKSIPELGMAYCHYTLVDEKLAPLKHQPDYLPLGKDAFRRLLMGNKVKSCSAVMAPRRILFESGLFDETLKGTDDWDLWLRISAKYPVYNDPSKAFLYRVHSSQVSNNQCYMRQGDIDVRLKWLDSAISKYPGIDYLLRARLAAAYRRLAKCLIRERQFSEAIKTINCGIRFYPWDARLYLLLLQAYSLTFTSIAGS